MIIHMSWINTQKAANIEVKKNQYSSPPPVFYFDYDPHDNFKLDS